jgi:HEAT repeat protein
MHRTLCLAAAALLAAAGVTWAQETSPVPVEKIKELIKRLGDDAFAVREKATEDLVALGKAALPLLREATSNPDLEIVCRARRCIERIGPPTDAPAALDPSAAERERQLRSMYEGARYSAIMDATRRANLMRRPGRP